MSASIGLPPAPTLPPRGVVVNRCGEREEGGGGEAGGERDRNQKPPKKRAPADPAPWVVTSKLSAIEVRRESRSARRCPRPARGGRGPLPSFGAGGWLP